MSSFLTVFASGTCCEDAASLSPALGAAPTPRLARGPVPATASGLSRVRRTPSGRSGCQCRPRVADPQPTAERPRCSATAAGSSLRPLDQASPSTKAAGHRGLRRAGGCRRGPGQRQQRRRVHPSHGRHLGRDHEGTHRPRPAVEHWFPKPWLFTPMPEATAVKNRRRDVRGEWRPSNDRFRNS